jgi:hypothetical protein
MIKPSQLYLLIYHFQMSSIFPSAHTSQVRWSNIEHKVVQAWVKREETDRGANVQQGDSEGMVMQMHSKGIVMHMHSKGIGWEGIERETNI